MHAKPSALFAAGAIVVAIAAGCAKGSDSTTSSTSSTTTTTSAASAPATQAMPAASGSSAKGTTAMGDAGRGKTIFGEKCASCHGASGTEGGVGPSLKGEKSRKNLEQTIAWIHNPAPPMPKLWPSPLNDKDVADVSAYVQSL